MVKIKRNIRYSLCEVNSQSNVVSKTRMDLEETWKIAMATFDLYHKDLPYEG